MSKKRWEDETLKPTLEKYPERKETLLDERDILNTPEDVNDSETELPGKFPYTRGIHATGYRGKLWTMRQYAGFGTAKETNERFRYLLSEGQNGLSVAFDLPTQIGYDSDDAMATGEVGKVGVAIDSVEDMDALFDQVPLDKVSTSMTINAPASILLAMYISTGKNQGVPQRKLRGTIQNDILKEYIARGTYIFPPKDSMRLTTDVFEYCANKVPNWNTISVSGYHIREAGCTAEQELAFTIANGIAYVQAAIEKGLEIDDFAPRMTFFFNGHNDFLYEIAKFRAAKKMWANIISERFGSKNEKSMTMKFHTQTGGSTLTAQQPHNNVVRTAIQALSAVLGGTQSLHTNAMDEALGLPSEKAAKVALRTQQIIAEESGIPNTVDPLAGSYTIEKMTQELCDKTDSLIEEIDTKGGILNCIEEGWVQSQIMDSAYKFQKEVEGKERIIVGVNDYLEDKEGESEDITKINEEAIQEQINKLSVLRETRGNVSDYIDIIEQKAMTKENLMPHLIKAVSEKVTIGEICNSLRKVWGEYRPKEIL
ncbi:MAG: methylmalonyl-CoA mutase family protein [Candidatus Poseidoniia archaeon]|jgi:methylmalonyl-CoA mutase N-terminal domain/subunit|nr:methylmalonyl-CoA mutase family protein [Candidatus Poseidoniia archaeon]MDP7095768.1 methylmalonyl-CoA mutase family protein [Candidatus Poseidoniia archaeon]MDP7665221.1 methylmalonyl-CoA mutase family protein [Candidatus Poseidoniia archaeon]